MTAAIHPLRDDALAALTAGSGFVVSARMRDVVGHPTAMVDSP